MYIHFPRNYFSKMFKIQSTTKETSKQLNFLHTFGKWQDVLVGTDEKLHFYLIMATFRNLIVE